MRGSQPIINYLRDFPKARLKRVLATSSNAAGDEPLALRKVRISVNTLLRRSRQPLFAKSAPATATQAALSPAFRWHRIRTSPKHEVPQQLQCSRPGQAGEQRAQTLRSPALHDLSSRRRRGPEKEGDRPPGMVSISVQGERNSG